MAKFHGSVGFATSFEKAPGVWVNSIVERPYFGDADRVARRLELGDRVNSNIVANHSIRIVADAFAEQNYANIKYVYWMNARWLVSSVIVQRPRLVLELGGVYDGPTPEET